MADRLSDRTDRLTGLTGLTDGLAVLTGPLTRLTGGLTAAGGRRLPASQPGFPPSALFTPAPRAASAATDRLLDHRAPSWSPCAARDAPWRWRPEGRGGASVGGAKAETRKGCGAGSTTPFSRLRPSSPPPLLAPWVSASSSYSPSSSSPSGGVGVSPCEPEPPYRPVR